MTGLPTDGINDSIVVPDTSAILTGKVDIFSLNCIVPESVLNEIKNGKESRIYDIDLGILKIGYPTYDSIKKVKKTADSTGDLKFLSVTDIEVIALALDSDGIILSDDYSIQNVASMLNIQFRPCGLDGIKKLLMWGFRCRGCGYTQKKMIETCPRCGHKMTRYPLER